MFSSFINTDTPPSKKETASFDWDLITKDIPTDKQHLFDDFKQNGVNHVTEENCNALMIYLEFACPPKVEAINLLLSAGNECKLDLKGGDDDYDS